MAGSERAGVLAKAFAGTLARLLGVMHNPQYLEMLAVRSGA
jgi:hypothetical protein